MADRVCFVSHEATLTGAPMSLLQLLRWLRANSDLALEVIVLERGDDGGRLLADFEAVAPTAVAGAGDLPVGRLSEVDVLYLNSVFSARALDGLGAGAYVIARVPELGMVFRHHLPAEDRDHLLRRANRFIAVSDRVRAMLVDDLDVAPEKVVRIHGFVDPAAFEGATPAAGRAVRRELGIPEDAAVVGGSGTTDWRKGPDLFVGLADAVHRRRPTGSVHFVWVGGEPEGPEFWTAQVAGGHPTAPLVHFLGPRRDAPACYAAMDVFTLTSREDPFPRVCLELASLHVPIVTFDNGGAPEFVGRGAGTVVAYLDVEAMADAVLGFLDDPDERARVGAEGAALVDREFTVETGGPAVLAEIERGLRHRHGAA